MCSAVREYTTCDSNWGGCREAAEDEKKTKEEDLAICWRPEASQDSSVTHIEQSEGPHGSSVADSVREQLRKSINRNFEGREYITRPTLLQIISKDVVHNLCQNHIFGRTHSRVTKGTPIESPQDTVEYIELEARVLLALWVFIDAPMQSFLALLEASISDASLPLTVDCPAGIDKVDFVRILESQWVFLPYDLFDQPGQVAIPNDLIVPLIFDKKRDLIGAGAFSDVFRVEVDNTNSTLPPKPERAPIYALKRFKDKPVVERSFTREYSVLKELVKVPHDHILLHLAAWSQGGVFYMIFPRARCNLRTFMDEVEYPGLAAGNVIWFFKQIRGLADAVRHIHALKPLPALIQFRKNKPVVETDHAAFHNDIKPENILVFDSDEGFPGVFKISDFGCGKVVDKDHNSVTPNTEGFYGTPEYESPDPVVYKQASKPNDIWALGCVFLELLDWFTIPRTEKPMTFQTQRYTGPGPTNPAFWCRNDQNKLQLTPQVGRKLMELENSYCINKRGLEYLLHIIWFLLSPDMKDRSTAEQVYNDVNHVTRQAIIDLDKDPDYYLRPGSYYGTRHLLTAALPTPSWQQDADKGGWHQFKMASFQNHDWDAIIAQVPDFPGHEPYLVDKHPDWKAQQETSEPIYTQPVRKDRETWLTKLQRVSGALSGNLVDQPVPPLYEIGSSSSQTLPSYD